MVDNLKAIKEALTTKRLVYGWEQPTDLSITVMNVGRDEDVFEESSIAQDFENNTPLMVSCTAVLIVPGKAIIGLVAIDAQDTEDKVPFVPFMLNDFKHRGQIKSFVKASCLNRGPFTNSI